MSRLPLRRGIHQLWITSRLVPRTSTLVSIGMTSWPLVTIGVGDAAAAVLRRVVHLPPPLVTRDVDEALGVVGLGEGEQDTDGGDRDPDQDDGRHDRHADLQDRPAVGLLGDRLAAVAVAEHRPADRRHDDETDHPGDGEHRPLEVVDLLRVVARRLPRVLRSVRRAAGNQQTTSRPQ